MKREKNIFKTGMAKKVKAFGLCCMFVIIFSVPAFAATMTLQAETVAEDQQDFDLVVSFTSAADEHVSALDFTLLYDNANIAVNSIDAEMNLEASGKVLETNEDVIGTVKGIVYGLNNNDIENGNLFTISCAKTVDAEAGTITISLSDVNGSTNTASAITISVVNGSLVFEGAEEEQDSAPVDGLQAPTILNDDELINTSNFTLEWTDESASGAASYVVTRMQKPTSPLEISDGLVSYWPMNETSGAAIDAVSGNDLQVGGSVTYSTDKPLGIITGSRRIARESYLRASSNVLDFPETGAMTFSSWIKPLGDSLGIDLFQGTYGDSGFYKVVSTPEGALKAVVSEDGVTATTATTAVGVVKKDVWQHIVFEGEMGSGGSGDNPIADSKGLNEVVATENVTVDENVVKFGKRSGYFNKGSVRIRESENTQFGQGDFTIDFWCNIEKLHQGNSVVFSYGKTDYAFTCIIRGSDLYIYGKGLVMVQPINWEMNRWYHVAITRYNGVVRTFRDGVQFGPAVNSRVNYVGDGDFVIGTRPQNDYPFYGYIDDFRITKGQAVWTSNFTPNQNPYDVRSEKETPGALVNFEAGTSVALCVNGKALEVTLDESDNEDAVSSSVVGNSLNTVEYLCSSVSIWNRCLESEEVASLSFNKEEVFSTSEESLEQVNLLDTEYLYLVQSRYETGHEVSDYSKAYVVTVDTIAPATPGVTSISSLISSRATTIEGSCSSDTSVLTVVSDTATIGAVVRDGNGWAVDVTFNEDGLHQFDILAEDEAGNLSAMIQRAIRVDTVAPTFNFASPTSNTYTVPRKQVYFVGTIDEQDISSFRCHYQTLNTTGDVTPLVVDGNFSFEYTMERGLNQLWMTVVDEAGNQTVETFAITYENNLPLVFNNLRSKSIGIDEELSFVVGVTNQNSIDPELLTYSVEGLPCQDSSNPAEFNTGTREFSWVPNAAQNGLYSVTFRVTDGVQSVSQEIKIVARTYDIGVADLSEIITLPQDKQAAVLDVDKDGFNDMYVVMHGANKLYMNNGDGTFDENALNAGVEDVDGLGNCVIICDINDDDWADLYIVNDGENKLFVNNQDGSFSDMTADYQLGDAGVGRDAEFKDLNGDGNVDLFIVNDGRNTYLQNLGDNTFSDETISAGFTELEDGVNVCIINADNDGNADVFVVNEGDNEFYLNNGDGTFIDASANVTGASVLSGFRGVVRDVNFDGVCDVYLVNTTRNIIYQCDGEGKLKAAVVNKTALSNAVHTKSAFYLDYDNDGSLDLFIVDATSKYIEGMGNILFKNDGDGNYTDVTAIAGLI